MTSGIGGDRVVLRPLVAGDAEVLRGFVNDSEVMQHSNTFEPVHDVNQHRWYDGATSDPGAIWFGIARVESEPATLIGTCCLVGIERISRLAELRIRIGDPRSWGSGLGTEVCTLLLRYAFQEQNLERIWLRVFARNQRAINLYHRLGFKEEGRLRRAVYLRGEYDDVVLMGLLRSEASLR